MTEVKLTVEFVFVYMYIGERSKGIRSVCVRERERGGGKKIGYGCLHVKVKY